MARCLSEILKRNWKLVMEEKQTYREVMPGELPCEVPECDGVMVVDPDNSYKLTCDKCGHIKE